MRTPFVFLFLATRDPMSSVAPGIMVDGTSVLYGYSFVNAVSYNGYSYAYDFSWYFHQLNGRINPT